MGRQNAERAPKDCHVPGAGHEALSKSGYPWPAPGTFLSRCLS